MTKKYIQPKSEVMVVRFIETICDTSAYVPLSSNKSFDKEEEVF